MTCNCKDCCNNCIRISNISEILKTVSEPNRLRVLCFLLEGKRCAGDIAKGLDIPHNLVSFHLKILLENNFLSKRREGNKIYYSVKKNIAYNIRTILDLYK